MPRKRFLNLAPERREKILAIAGEEFAEHGYEVASYNRIIERSGVSKGAFYYYFDDKEDLYATVMRDAMERLVMAASPMEAATDAASFWRQYEAWFIASIRGFQEDPVAVGLARSMMKALARGTASEALAELRAIGRGWVEGFIDQGQALGAVRTDLPRDLLVRLLLSLEEAVDLWLGDHIGDLAPTEIATVAAMLTGLYRRLTGPEPVAPRLEISGKRK